MCKDFKVVFEKQRFDGSDLIYYLTRVPKEHSNWLKMFKIFYFTFKKYLKKIKLMKFI